jgi:hypothetical protein
MVGQGSAGRYTGRRVLHARKEVHVFNAFTLRSITQASCICACSVLLLSAGYVGAQVPVAPRAQGSPDAAAHQQWMNDASDAQEDFRFAVTDKNQKLASEAFGKLEMLMGKTEDYWAARKSADGVRLAKEARAYAAQGSAAAQAGNLTAAGEAFGKLGATCNTCHDLHLEKR